MLLNKYWLETKNRFLLGILSISAVCLFFVLGQPWILHRWALDEIRDPGIYNPPWVEIAKKDYNYFIWHFLYNYLLQLTWVIFTMMLALGGITHESEKGSALFTLSLPVTRKRLFFGRTLIGFGQALILALLPAIIIPAGSVFTGQHYEIVAGLNHSLLFIVGGCVFYPIAILLNTVIKTEAVSFFVTIGSVFVFYFLFQPYSEGMKKPLFLKLIDLPGFMAGNANSVDFISDDLVTIFSCITIGTVFTFLAYTIVQKRDF